MARRITKKTGKASGLGQLIIPLTALGILLLFNLIRDPGFFAIRMAVNNNGNNVLSGNLISIIDSASALAIIAMGMTLVTAACGGQDISVGAVGAIAGAFGGRAMILGITGGIASGKSSVSRLQDVWPAVCPSASTDR